VSSSIVSAYLKDGGGAGNARSGMIEFDMRFNNSFANGSGMQVYADVC
jgi:hypothetical protein